MTNEQYHELARGAIERHLGDVCEGEDSADSIYSEAYSLAIDALIDAGCHIELAGAIASDEAQKIAQP